jgi:hypothetical protein
MYNKLRPKRVLLDSQYTAKLSLIPFTTGIGVGPKLSDTEYSSYNEVNIQNEKKKGGKESIAKRLCNVINKSSGKKESVLFSEFEKDNLAVY